MSIIDSLEVQVVNEHIISALYFQIVMAGNLK